MNLRKVCLEYDFEDVEVATNKFERSRRLGAGGFGTVYRGEMPDGSSMAVKVIEMPTGRKQEHMMELFAEELTVLSKFRHPNIVVLMGWAHKENKYILLYELMSGSDLLARLVRTKQGKVTFDARQRLTVARDACSGLAHMHNAKPKAFHRDIKSANILLEFRGSREGREEVNAKIADFGLSLTAETRRGAERECQWISGTAGYFCPNYQSSGIVSEASEVYSFGIVLFEILLNMRAVEMGADKKLVFPIMDLVKPVQPGARQRCADAADRTARFHPDTAMSLAQLSLRCVHRHDEERPRFNDACQELRSLLRKTEELCQQPGNSVGQPTAAQASPEKARPQPPKQQQPPPPQQLPLPQQPPPSPKQQHLPLPQQPPPSPKQQQRPPPPLPPPEQQPPPPSSPPPKQLRNTTPPPALKKPTDNARFQPPAREGRPQQLLSPNRKENHLLSPPPDPNRDRSATPQRGPSRERSVTPVRNGRDVTPQRGATPVRQRAATPQATSGSALTLEVVEILGEKVDPAVLDPSMRSVTIPGEQLDGGGRYVAQVGRRSQAVWFDAVTRGTPYGGRISRVVAEISWGDRIGPEARLEALGGSVKVNGAIINKSTKPHASLPQGSRITFLAELDNGKLFSIFTATLYFPAPSPKAALKEPVRPVLNGKTFLGWRLVCIFAHGLSEEALSHEPFETRVVRLDTNGKAFVGRNHQEMKLLKLVGDKFVKQISRTHLEFQDTSSGASRSCRVYNVSEINYAKHNSCTLAPGDCSMAKQGDSISFVAQDGARAPFVTFRLEEALPTGSPPSN